jgi:hypothetical protein
MKPRYINLNNINFFPFNCSLSLLLLNVINCVLWCPFDLWTLHCYLSYFIQYIFLQYYMLNSKLLDIIWYVSQLMCKYSATVSGNNMIFFSNENTNVPHFCEIKTYHMNRFIFSKKGYGCKWTWQTIQHYN